LSCDNIFCSRLAGNKRECKVKGGLLLVKSRYDMDTKTPTGIVNVTSKDCKLAEEILKEYVLCLICCSFLTALFAVHFGVQK
jgi:hypothetical protein